MALYGLYFLTEDGKEHVRPIVEHDGERWFVADLPETPTKEPRRPERIICIEYLAKENPPPGIRADVALSAPVDREVLEGRQLSQRPRVMCKPDLFIDDADFDYRHPRLPPL
jgi:hypothetical protein